MAAAYSAKQYRGVYVGNGVYSPVSITIPSVATGAATTVTVVLGDGQATLGDVIDVSPIGAAIPAGLVVSAHPTATPGSIVVNVFNGTGGTYNPGAVNYTVVVSRPKTA